MANNCCGDSIYNKQKSIIPVPNCAPECPPDLGCEIITPATCVSIIPSIYCLELGDNLQDALSVITDAICNIIPPSGYAYTVAVDATDTCPGYLEDKITSSCLDVTVLNVSGCKSVNIEPKLLDWKNLVLNTGWFSVPATPLSTYQAPQYALDCNGKVWFRGTCYKSNSDLNTLGINGCFDASLQIDDITPLFKRTLSNVKFLIPSGLGYAATYAWFLNMDIKEDSSTFIYGGYLNIGAPTTGGSYYVNFDGFSYELN
jgi:hypothetical protein